MSGCPVSDDSISEELVGGAKVITLTLTEQSKTLHTQFIFWVMGCISLKLTVTPRSTNMIVKVIVRAVLCY